MNKLYRLITTKTRGLTQSQLRFITNRKPRHSEEYLAEKFVDERRMQLVGGDGGDGCSIFHRDRISAFGGPSGGSGGKGGDLWLRADRSMMSLGDVKKYYRAKKGEDGRGKFYNGKSAKPLVVNIPVGTRLVCDDTNEVLTEFRRDGETYLVCSGGLGGKGNMFFKSSLNVTASECTSGSPGDKRFVRAELLLIADAGLVGFPNAGKSTLLRALSRAKPQIGEYAFTTLSPHVGVIEYEDFQHIAVADLPGLVEDAHQNEGLGFKFLKHVQRCRFLVYVCDLSVEEPWLQVDKLKLELELFDEALPDHAKIVIANKLDLQSARDNFEKFCEEVLKDHPSLEIVPLSGINKTNIESVICKLREVFDKCEKSEFDRETPWWRLEEEDDKCY